VRRALVSAGLLALCGVAGAEMATYGIDPTHTFASFEVLHRGTSFITGRFDRQEGSLQFDRAGRVGQAEISIDMNSINTGVAALDRELRGAGGFNAEAFPRARFVGQRFVFDGDKVAEVAGSLTLAGTTAPLTLKATRFNCYFNPLFKREVCGGDFEATLQRSQWGITTGLPAFAPDDVRLLVQVEAIRQ
jgi:polyisoprenoid-binding protein YceI